MTRDEIVDALTAKDVRRDIAVMYADAFLEYAEASENIRKTGSIVAHPRTSNPIENPYLPIRDRARLALQRMGSAKTDFLWTAHQPTPPA